MAAARPPAQGPSVVPIVLVLTVVAAVIATWWGYPGLIALPAGIMVAAFVAPPAVHTGKKDANGYATAANPAEEKAMNRYRMWSELKWKTLVPSADWLPGWPVRLWWVAALLLSAAALALPAPAATGSWRYANAAGLFIAIIAANSAIRRWTAPDDPCPGPTFDHVLTGVRQGAKGIVLAVGAGVAGAAVFLAALVVVNRFHWATLITPVQPWMLAAALGLAAVATVLAIGVRGAALAQWRTMVRVRAEWTPRWQVAKIDPMPRLVDYEEVGSVTIATFEVSPMVGAAGVAAVTSKIQATSPNGTRVAFLDSPALDTQGQPQPGSTHQLRFRIATFIEADMPNVMDPSTDVALVKLMLEAGMSWTAEQGGIGRWVLVDVEPLHRTGNDADEADDKADNHGGTAAWLADFAQPAGPPAKYFRDNGFTGALANNVGAEVLLDNKARGNIGDLYVGGLTGGTTDFVDSKVPKVIDNLEIENRWSVRWSDILKMGAIQPRPEHAVFATARVGDVTLQRQPFVVQQGLDPLDFFKDENKIGTTLSAAPFVSVTGFMVVGPQYRHNTDRHPQAFCVTWADRPVPSKPAALRPELGEGPKWVLAGLINRAFDAARLARPEVVKAEPVTEKTSATHIWKMTLRLYNGVTYEDVRRVAGKIKTELGAEWMRVENAEDGCVIVAGADHMKARKLELARRGPGKDYLIRLDWAQAFSDSGVAGVGGVLPQLVKSDVLPANDAVQVLDFKLPSGVDRQMIKWAVSKLMAATGNAFVEMRPADSADTVRLLVSHEHPLPNRASVDWAVVDEKTPQGDLPFATGVEGEPVCFNAKSAPHLLVAGASGGGKSITLQMLLYPAAVAGADIYVIDPTKAGADFQFVEPYAKAFASTIEEAAAVMRAIYEQVKVTKSLNAKYGVGSYRDLPDDVRPKHTYLVMDEFTSLMQPDPVSRTPSDDPEVELERENVIALNNLKAYIGTMTGKIAREARSAGVTLILATQKLSAAMLDSIPGAGDLKTNLARILMGSATFGEKQSALKNATEAQDMGDVIPPGRGLWESTEAHARLIQVWFEPKQETLAAMLAERVQPLAPEEKLDLTPYLDKSSASDDKAVVVKKKSPFTAPAGTGSQDDDEGDAPEVVELGAIQFTLDELDVDDDDAPETASVITLAKVEDADAEDIEDDDEDDLDWETLTQYADAVQEDEPRPGADSTHLTVSWPDSDVSGVEDVGEILYLTPPSAHADSVYGWAKLDVAITAILDYPQVEQVTWVDPQIFDEDDIGITYAELVEDVLADLGVSVTALTDLPRSEPAPTAVNDPALALAPAPVVAAPVVAVPEPKRSEPVPDRPAAVVAEVDGFDDPVAKPAIVSVFDDLF